ncbi:MAG: DUF3102 domain-containing protein [Clostridiales bacterium]|nr:DUF3102 domain-containing protein [Clostridiales bacterium]
MNEIAMRDDGRISVLEGLALEARLYSEAIATNMLQLGRVLIDAKKLVKHGEWSEWVRLNAHMSETTAQYMMRSFERFGQTPEVAALEKSKIFKMLSLPSGTEQTFIEENDITNMTAREVENAVRKVKEEYEAKIKSEQQMRMKAEAKAEELASKPPEIPDNVLDSIRVKDQEIEKYRQECARIAEEAKELLSERERLYRDLRESESLIEEQQQEYDRVQTELLNAQSMAAKGDAERTVTDELTAADFARAVGQFIGIVSRIPHMGRKFTTMAFSEREDFDASLKVIEKWAAGARKAINTVEVRMEGMIINAE